MTLPNIHCPIIAVDLGNTRAKFGVFSSLEEPFPAPDRVFMDSINDPEALFGRLTEFVAPDTAPLLWLIAKTGSFPWDSLRERIQKMRPADRFHDITHVDIPLVVDVDFPEKVGIDRLLAAYTAFCWQTTSTNGATGGTPPDPLERFLVVDAGSAITIDLVSVEGTFEGGAILPGLNAQAESVRAISERLPRIKTDSISFAVYPGKNTEEAIAGGIYWGAVGAVNQIRQLVRYALDGNEPQSHCVPVFLTGGDAGHLYTGLSMFMDPKHLIQIPEMVLCGIALATKNGRK